MENKDSGGMQDENLSQKFGKTIKEFWEYSKGLMHLETDTEADANERPFSRLKKAWFLKGPIYGF